VELHGGRIRASDRDRERVSEELRVHWTEGRIDAEELERRLAAAVSAQTIHDLALVVVDLPSVEVPARVASPARPPRIGPPGIRPFTQRIEIPAPIERVRELALDSIAVGLNGAGYELISQTPTDLDFVRSVKERVTIDLEPRGHGATMMVVHGRAPRRIRKQFAQLRFG
jgi:hypothetical protein